MFSWYVAHVFFLNYFEIVPFAPTITGITCVFTLHVRCISIVRSLYFRIFSSSFLITFLSPEIATSINIHVPFSLSRIIMSVCGPGSSVGIATDYGLDGPGSNPGGDEIFRPSRQDLGPIQPPVKWVPGLSRG